MNELCTLLSSVRSGETVTLEPGRIYHVRQDDSFELSGCFCSNSARQNENPDGHRYSAIHLKDKKDVVIDGNGATVLVHGKMTPFLLDRCENIAIRNLVVDYACPTMTEFAIVENRGGVITFRIHPDCLFRVDGNRLYWHGETGLDGKPYWEDRVNDAFGKGGYRYGKAFLHDNTTQNFDCSQLTFSKIEQLDAHTLRCTLDGRKIDLPVGTIIQTRNVIRDQVGGMLQRCKDLRFENLRIRFMHGLGMVSQFCENVTFVNCDCSPKEGRTIASTADFFHFSGCRGRLIIDGCRAWGAQDDFVNVHGTHLQIRETDPDAKTMLVRFCHPETWGFQAFEEGDSLEFIRWDTLIPYTKTKVTAFEKVNPTDILLHVTSIPEGIVLGKDVVENASWTPDVHICNCSFGPSHGRGILCTTRGKVVIENNRFDTIVGAALCVEDDCNFWFESGYTREIIFRNNELIACNYGNTMETAPAIQYTPKVMDENSQEFVHGKLVLTGNQFLKPQHGGHSIWLEYLREAIVEDNVFDAPYAIHTKICSNVADQNNTIK